MVESDLIPIVLSAGALVGAFGALGFSVYYLVDSIKKGKRDDEYLKKQELIEAERQYWDSFICA
ncbi:MAG: hypothetical protein PHH00_02310 [Candidatus Nanoarchaeia archaeon]|nr:hypothetical protein [Candidatus Nanoarchaeia archaeon]